MLYFVLSYVLPDKTPIHLLSIRHIFTAPTTQIFDWKGFEFKDQNDSAEHIFITAQIPIWGGCLPFPNKLKRPPDYLGHFGWS